MTETTTTRPVIAALEAAWQALQSLEPTIPDVVIVVASGTMHRQPRRGHFAAERWHAGADDAANVHEVLVAGERLADGAEAVLTTLAHEAAHAACHAQGIQDVSRGGRYHNAKFAEMAKHLGCLVEPRGDGNGYGTTGLAPEAQAWFGAELAELEAAIRVYRRDELAVMLGALGTAGVSGTTRALGRGRKSSNNGRALVCACDTPRRIRVAASVAELGPITCGLCGAEFA